MSRLRNTNPGARPGKPRPGGQDRDGESRSGEDPLHAVYPLPEEVWCPGSRPIGEDEKDHHARHVDHGFPQGTVAVLIFKPGESLLPYLFFPAEYSGHEEADDDAEENRPHCAGNAQLKPENPCGEDDGEDVDGWPGIEKSGGRA